MSPNSFRATIFLCVSAIGAKLRPLTVFAGVPGGVVEKVLWSPAFDWGNTHYVVQKSAYCDATVTMTWIKEVCGPEVARPSVILLDSLKVDKMEEKTATVLKDYHTKLEFVPPSATVIASARRIGDQAIQYEMPPALLADERQQRFQQQSQWSARAHCNNCNASVGDCVGCLGRGRFQESETHYMSLACKFSELPRNEN